MKGNKQQRADTIIEVDFRRLGFLAVTVIMCVLTLLTLLFYLRSFLPVKVIEMEGISSYYNRSELIETSGIDYGDKLYSIDLGKAENKIMSDCAYIESIELKRSFPDKLIFSVTEKTPQWYIEVTGDFYVLDENLTVLQESTNEDILKVRGLTRLELPSVKSAVCGELPEFGSDELEIKRSCELINTIRQHPLKLRVTHVDIASRFEIYITVDGSFVAYCGDMSSMKAKLDALAKVLTEDFRTQYAGADIDVSVPSTVGVVGRTQ